ncbi:hypothetical protein CS0771_02180 [Catellatospora sp. IY07-71]|uniref:ATP-dependent nuclease n=1 Tax=Catellatospora sp. IY07-71 TaxID=2728827 RepID=UPI001BB336AA|nr:TOPRIM nucleotidyl transferase/hydrolase domain-containing protein [Catellatospora sp. IY07-71]BCJ70674.1 hypothetical protein CS0771_02180 [Catellatospora sp. IY07-71]
MRLASVKVSGFRSLRQVGPIPLRRPTILAGHNDAGKTAVIDAIAFLLGDYQITDDDPTFMALTSDADTERKRVDSIEVRGEFLPSESERTELGLPERIAIRRIWSEGGNLRLESEEQVPQDARLRGIASKTMPALREIARDFSVTVPAGSLKPVWVKTLEDFAKTQSAVIGWTPVRPDVRDAMPRLLRFGEAGSVEAAVKAALNDRYREHLDSDEFKLQVKELEQRLQNCILDDANDLISHIKVRCTDLVSVTVEPDVSFKGGLQRTRLRLARTDGEEVPLTSVGSGRSRRISLAIWEWTSDILRRDVDSGAAYSEERDVVIVYDEPDTHLDYLQQRRVMELIREQCDLPGVAMVVATHSMNLIDGAAIDDIIHLQLVDERTVAKRLLDDSSDAANTQHLADIAAALGLRNTVLLHERCFVGVEGASEQQAFPILFKLATGRSLQAAGVVIVACNNNEGALNFVGYLARSGRQTLMIVDADSGRNRLFSDTRLASVGLRKEHCHWLGLPDKELEYLFTDKQWADVGNRVWRRNDAANWTSENISALRGAAKFSKALEDLFATESDTGPASKTELVYELSRSLTRPEDIPKELRDAFSKLVGMAALDR